MVWTEGGWKYKSEHFAKYDSTAGMAIAAGLLELTEHVDGYEKELYYKTAVKILKTCGSKFCSWNLGFQP